MNITPILKLPAVSNIIRLLLAIVMFGVSFECRPDDINRQFKDKSSVELMGRASAYIEADTLLDRAVAALSEVANRYYAKPSDTTARQDAIRAMYQLGNIYSLRIFDYPKAYANLTTARMLAEEEHDDYDLALILVRLANIYNVCYDDADKSTIFKLLSEALDRAIAGNNEEVITRLAMNLSIMQFLEGGWGTHAGEIDKIKKHMFPAGSVLGTICTTIIDGMESYFKGDYHNAEAKLRKVLSVIPKDHTFRERYEYGTMYLLQYVYEKSGDYTAEEKLLRERLRLVNELSLDDYELYTYSHLANFFDRRNQPDSVKKYTYLYLLKKEELNQNSGLNKVENVEMLRKIEKANEETRELAVSRQKERRRLTIAIAVSVVVVVLLLAFVYLFLNLKRNHKLLFRKNQELLDREKQLRMLLAEKPVETKAGKDSSSGPVEEAEEDGPDEESLTLFPRILEVMERNKAIYGLGFGIDDLSTILHVSRRSVSKAINVCGGANFHQFLNGYRIREACRLMQTTDPTSTTVEYIAESVGFKSRTSFALLFKKTTGLTPSEYWKMARKNQ